MTPFGLIDEDLTDLSPALVVFLILLSLMFVGLVTFLTVRLMLHMLGVA